MLTRTRRTPDGSRPRRSSIRDRAHGDSRPADRLRRGRQSPWPTTIQLRVRLWVWAAGDHPHGSPGKRRAHQRRSEAAAPGRGRIPGRGPRVGNDVAFFIVEGAPGETSIPEINGIQMRAWQVRLDVVPEAGRSPAALARASGSRRPTPGAPGHKRAGTPTAAPAPALATTCVPTDTWSGPQRSGRSSTRPTGEPAGTSCARSRRPPNCTARHRGPDLGHPLRRRDDDIAVPPRNARLPSGRSARAGEKFAAVSCRR